MKKVTERKVLFENLSIFRGLSFDSINVHGHSSFVGAVRGAAAFERLMGERKRKLGKIESIVYCPHESFVVKT